MMDIILTLIFITSPLTISKLWTLYEDFKIKQAVERAVEEADAAEAYQRWKVREAEWIEKGRLRRLAFSGNLFRNQTALRNVLRRSVNKSIRYGTENHLMGIRVNQFRSRIQGMFREGMSWDNWGSVWELDHIKPLASFDMTKREEKKKAFNYTNCQPLFVEENREKGCRL